MDEITCIGCGKCVRACPASFEIEESKYGRARVIQQQQGGDAVEEVQVGWPASQGGAGEGGGRGSWGGALGQSGGLLSTVGRLAGARLV